MSMIHDTLGGEWPEPVRLDLGCGPYCRAGFVGIDKNPSIILLPESRRLIPNRADIWHDLDRGIPFPDASIDEIYAGHFLEHVANVYNLLDECWRVLKPGATILILVPLLEMTSPDHITCFYADWFERNTRAGYHLAGKFDIVERQVDMIAIESEGIGFWQLKVRLKRL